MNQLLSLAHQPWAQTLGWTLLHFLWQGALLGLLAWGGLALLRGAEARVRYGVACAFLLLMVGAPPATFALLDAQAAAPARLVLTELPGEAAGPLVLASELPLGARLQRACEPALPWLLGGWAAGVLLLSLRFTGGWIHLQRLRRRAARPVPAEWHLVLSRLCRELKLTRTVRLLQSAAVEVPTALGFLRPVILLPACALSGLSPLQLEAILAHELAHIRRGDFLVNLLQSLVEVLLFYHPAVWWLSARIRTEREHCCDDVAADLVGDSLLLARALADLEALRAMEPAPTPKLALAATGGSLMHRIRHLLHPALPVPSAARTTALALVAASILGAAGAALQDKVPPPPPPPPAPSPEAKTIRLKTVEGDRQMSITLKGEVKAHAGAKEPFTLGPDGSLQAEEKKAGKTRVYRQDAQGRRYTVDGQERALDADGEAWLQEVARSIEKGRKHDKVRIVTVRTKGGAAPGEPVQVDLQGEGPQWEARHLEHELKHLDGQRQDLDIQVKHLDLELKNLDTELKDLPEAERARVKAELERAREDLKRASKDMDQHRKEVIVLRDRKGRVLSEKDVKVEVITGSETPGHEGDDLVVLTEGPEGRKVEKRVKVLRRGGDPAQGGTWAFLEAPGASPRHTNPQAEIRALQSAMKSMQKRLDQLQKQLEAEPRTRGGRKAPQAAPPPPPPPPAPDAPPPPPAPPAPPEPHS